MESEIKRLIRNMEYLGEVGKLEESERLSEEVERLKRSK
jgi:hypothetical protein